MAAALLPDPLWDLVGPFLPIPRRWPLGGRRVSDRACLTGIVFVLRSDIPWQMLPQSSGPGGCPLTAADFGVAYLVERWAARFVSELFQQFDVVFVGYRVTPSCATSSTLLLLNAVGERV